MGGNLILVFLPTCKIWEMSLSNLTSFEGQSTQFSWLHQIMIIPTRSFATTYIFSWQATRITADPINFARLLRWDICSPHYFRCQIDWEFNTPTLRRADYTFNVVNSLFLKPDKIRNYKYEIHRCVTCTSLLLLKTSVELQVKSRDMNLIITENILNQ